ncbi:peptidase A8 [Thioalkalivibrio paradoxus ARh 1]|uniref:Lipoprotein signal peptidase n=1 Tax=Thioalkalivibrio paradoxus ARh 1 TaxID=713585 RepID=W0DIJ2_9GAMM|nr:peptidase A8 [Thioalkalivibrio paradoxus ARh 1]
MVPGLAIAAVVFVLDQITKLWAEHALTLYAPIEVTGFFNLTLVYNPGAAFSFLSAAGGWQRWLLSGIALGVGVLIVVWLRRLPRQAWLMMASLGLILGGALGNLVDRLRLGMVVDFLDFHYAGLHWPAFNVADAAITVGAICLIVATCTEQCGPNRQGNAR